jgi:prepilin-type N-terminal cleavage/methylation domain-containing protein
MTTLAARLRRRLEPHEGMTLPEIMITMSILGIVLLIGTTMMASIQRTVTHEESLTRTLDAARLAVQQLDRELRSGNVLYDPSLENAPVGTPGRIASCDGCEPGYTLRVYTQTNADTRSTLDSSNGYRCVLWKIDDQQRLMMRYWQPLQALTTASSWRIVTSGVVNRELSVAAFALDTDVLKGGRTLNVVYALNSDLTHHAGQTAKIQASLTGRNTSYGYPANVCQQTPPG